MLISSCNCNRKFPLYFPSLAISVFGCSKLPLSASKPRTSIGVSAALAADTQTLPQSAIQRIAEKLRSLGYVEEGISKENPEETQDSYPVSPSPGEIFVPLRSHLPKHRVGHTLDPSWSTPENPVPEPGTGDAIQRFHELRRGVLKEKEEERLRNQKKERAPTLAELTLPVDEIKRLTSLGIGLKKRLKVGKAGITEGIVNGIHERWRRYEIVRIACEDICRLNMKRTHDLLERKTGGLVIWRSGSNIILHRGADYKYPYFFTDNYSSDDSSSGFSPDINTDEGINDEIGISSQGNKAVVSPVHNSCMRVSGTPLVQGVGLPNRVRFQLPGEALLAEEADKLLEGLGPRFTDWWGYDPLPVDADLLPAIVRGYRKPFRLLPYGVKPKLTNDEMTTLRRLGLPLPCHFALGRNRKLQGLAASIVKLWEKCEIAKIAIKRGVQNTNSELMAEELKGLTGGTLLSRDREFITLYRGKDFLPIAVSSAIEGRRKGRLAISQPRTDDIVVMNTKEIADGTNEYSPEVELNEQKDQKFDRSEPRKLRFSEAAIERTSAKLNIALAKKARAEKLLEALEKEEISQPPEVDKEGLTEEERYMLRRVGLRMGPFLLMGRRGVFDGTVENMHLHWKYRELVKILIGRRSIEEVHQAAQTLEAESGGILVAVEQVSKGYAIIIYRGKNYKRPASLRPRTLLSKREALKRSIEAQRRQSLKLHVLELTKNIDELKLKMAKDKDTNDLLLAKDVKLGFVKEPEFGEIYVNEDKSCDKDRNGEDRSHFEYLAEEIRENQETDANSVRRVDFVPSSYGPVSVGRLGLTRDILHSDIDGKDARDMPKEEPQPILAPKDPQDSSNIAAHIDFSVRRESQDQVNTSATTFVQPHFCDTRIDCSKANLEYSAGKATQNESTIYRATQLSNKERLILRKQALRMKNQPVLAVGKRNIMSGIAKTINAHFKKHSLAIVSIKGRAEGTSIREVVRSLEQATGSVLVSQEPTKVILYKRRESDEEPIQDGENTKLDSKNYRVNVERKGRGLVSPELMSAIRIECGL